MPTFINLGRLTQRVTIQRRNTADNSLGEAAGGWVDMATVWAEVTPLRSRDQFLASAAQRNTDHRVIIRCRADVDGACRLVWRGEPMEIEGEPVRIDGGTEWLEISAIKGVRDGR